MKEKPFVTRMIRSGNIKNQLLMDVFTDNFKIETLDVATKLFKESREGFLKLFNNSPICMSMTTLGKRTYVRVNKKFQEKFGYDEMEVIGHTSIEAGILDEEESAKVAAIIKEKGRLQNDYVKCRAKDGRIVHTVSSIESMEMNGENYLVSFFLDITKIMEQQAIIEQQNKDIHDSINYASCIQKAMLPADDEIQQLVKDFFVMYKPKDVVSGDFYTVVEKDGKIIIAAVDCTGHGVPGAFMSMIGNDQLNHIILEREITNPAEILTELNKGIKKVLKQKSQAFANRDGMDIAICSISYKNNCFEFAGAMRPLFYMNGELKEIKADKVAIGGTTEENYQFKNHVFNFNPGESFYLSSDGYADQFGGTEGKKFMTKNFKKLLVSIRNKPMKEQQDIVHNTFEEWKQKFEQIDDVLVMGVRL